MDFQCRLVGWPPRSPQDGRGRALSFLYIHIHNRAVLYYLSSTHWLAWNVSHRWHVYDNTSLPIIAPTHISQLFIIHSQSYFPSLHYCCSLTGMVLYTYYLATTVCLNTVCTFSCLIQKFLDGILDGLDLAVQLVCFVRSHARCNDRPCNTACTS